MPDTTPTILTNREHQLALLVAQGMTNKEIALRLGISVFTVRNELTGLLRKANATRRSEIAFMIGQNQAVQPPATT